MGQKKTPVFPLDKAIGSLLDGYRREQDKSLRALAELTGISHSRIGEFFRGERALTTGETDKLCSTLGLSPLKVLEEAERSLSAPSTSKPSNVTQLHPRRRAPEPDFTAMAAHTTRRDPREDYDQADYE